MGAAVRDHRNAVRDRSESLSAINRNPRPQSPESAPDILTTGLKAVFCGINPAASATISEHNFSAPSNQFWTVLHLSGFTAERLKPQNEHRLLDYSFGITAVVRRPTRRASEVSLWEFRRARREFEERMRRFAPRSLAFLGKRAYAALLDRRSRGDVRAGQLEA
jgi:mismatch-specific thymine-DNA glycosylase